MSEMIMPPHTYKLSSGGGVVRSDGASIPPSDDNYDWQMYQEWLADGNTPDPEFTAQELLDMAVAEEVAGLKADLQQALVWQFRMMIELFSLLKGATVVNNTDVDPEILTRAQQWITKLNRLKEIDE